MLKAGVPPYVFLACERGGFAVSLCHGGCWTWLSNAFFGTASIFGFFGDVAFTEGHEPHLSGSFFSCFFGRTLAVHYFFLLLKITGHS